MFTEQQLKAAHSKVRTGADFPEYIHEIKQLGLLKYEFWVDNGRITYYGANDHIINSDPKYPLTEISGNPLPGSLKQTILIHQQGATDFITFCKQAANAGAEKWVIDTRSMTCTYYDAASNVMVVEPIPKV